MPADPQRGRRRAPHTACCGRGRRRRAPAAMHGTWTWSWHSVMFILILHIMLYALIFLVCAFFATRQFRRMRNPVPHPSPSPPPRRSLGPRSLHSATPRVGVAQKAAPAVGCASLAVPTHRAGRRTTGAQVAAGVGG